MANFVNGRVTSSMMSSRYLSGMNKNLNNLQKINNQLTTGKEISRPSDNPYKVARTMQLNTDINTNTQYNENIKDTTNWLDTTDTALGQVTSVVQRIRTLMVSAGNAAYGSSEKSSIADEVNERVSELSQILNTNFDGKYIFGGTKVASKPTAIEVDASGNKIKFAKADGSAIANIDDTTDVEVVKLKNILSSDMNTEISQGVKMAYNVTAMDILKFDSNGDGSTDVDMLGLLGDISKNLVSANPTESAKVTNENLADMDKVITNLLKIRSEVGAKQNRMESAQTQNEDQNYNMTDILSKTEDIDFTEKSIEYSMAQTVYTASLQVSAQVLPQTLLDYL